MTQQSTLRPQLTNNNGMTVTLCDFGARILSIKVPNADGELVETTLNYVSDEDIFKDASYMGATCGRIANRVSQAQYEYQNETVYLNKNEGKNTLHGGAQGFSHRFWNLDYQDAEKVVFSLLSEDGDQGFPGNLIAKVTYSVNNENSLRIDYQAQCDKPCPINMCNHAYFTMGEQSIHDLQLQVNATSYLPIDSQNLPTGEIAQVNKAFDFRQTTILKDKLALRDFDDCYVVDEAQSVILTSVSNRLRLLIESDHIGMQVYTGNYLPVKYSAIALEAQGLIDAVNHSALQEEWVSPTLPYSRSVKYTFVSY